MPIRDVEFLNHDDTRSVRLELSTRVDRGNPYHRIAGEFGRIVGRIRHAAIMTGGGPGPEEGCIRRWYGRAGEPGFPRTEILE